MWRGGRVIVGSTMHVLLTFVDLPGYPDAGSPVGNSIGKLVNPGSLMKTSQTTLVVLTLQVVTVIMNSRTKLISKHFLIPFLSNINREVIKEQQNGASDVVLYTTSILS